jgi:polar amino acid transport system substrate-binding protein
MNTFVNNGKLNNIAKGFAMVFAMVMVLLASVTLTSCGESDTKNVDSASTNNAKSAPATASFRDLKQIQDSGTVKIGVFVDKSPFGYLDENGKNVGYDVYYGDQLGHDLGVKVEYIPLDAAARVDSLVSNKVDVVLANFTVTAERQEKVDFTSPYMKVALGLASKKSSPIKSLDEFADGSKKLTVVTGTTAETYLEKNYPDLLAKALKFEQYAQVQNALEDGRADAWLTDNTEAISFANSSSNFVADPAAQNIGDLDTIAPAVAKGNLTLLNFINTELKSLGEEKFFHKNYEATLLDVYGPEFEDELVNEGVPVESK